MATSITIRDVPEKTRDELAARAARTGRSLQEYLRSQMIELARRPDAEVLLEQVRARKARLETRLPAARILAHKDTERR
jgi:antitoxin FitA